MPLHPADKLIYSVMLFKKEKKEQGEAKAMSKYRKIEHLKTPKKTNQNPNRQQLTSVESKSELSEGAKVSAVPDELATGTRSARSGSAAAVQPRLPLPV